MVQPIKRYRAGNISGAVWLNEREVNGNIVGFKTVSLRRSWKDKEKDLWRDETLNMRKQDLAKLQVILHEMQKDILLAEEKVAEEKEEETDEDD